MSNSATIKPFITNKESKLISLEMELKATTMLITMKQYTSEDEHKALERYLKSLTDHIVELTILGGG